ncbi:MAG: Uma2 family endonuclease [Chloroflexia bacterium]|nr:Uma2 family endonuclease [Chloroflexia bacterium]
MTATAMKATQTVPAEQFVILHDISWELYERLLAEFADRPAPRLVYDRGVLEIMSPGPQHEEDHLALAAIVSAVAEELDLDFRPTGSMTFRRRDLEQGFEADSSFYVTNERFARNLAEIEPTKDPPPDLVIETDVSRSTLDKLVVYAGFGVPEVWRSHAGRVSILLLEAETYREMPRSRVLPLLTSEDLARFLAESRVQRRPEWLRSVRAWARERAGQASAE